ncbi:FAD-binding oxidoreductase [Ruegeria sp. 2205SS24-7]|uniref:NAD(P)/FAD-dependent oxidoreductase n=1 Tax=Ruegeria discodermiae TaxID=3064389 RepID=UPI0027406B48|nr:FAD-binding oxidoreductase [Ruegeria sp. 2205SS24-7]MDP5218095.1 FAD-binding oxidoreductase [Ruegeria sp. 2205SS24-7]
MTRLFEKRAYGPEPIANSYWPTTVSPPRYAPLSGGHSCDTAVIGAGYTGLNAALELARAGQDVVVLEGEQPGWGASGRNGGFCCLGGSAAGFQTLTRQVGREGALAYLQAEREAVDFVRARLSDCGIDADIHSRGETCLAHSPSAVAGLQALIGEIREIYGVDAEFLPREALASHGLASPEFHAALTTPIGFALNPMKYVIGLAQAAEAAGVRLHGNSAVTGLKTAPDGRHLVQTAQGEVRAINLIIATNGYSSEKLPPWLGGRYLPVPSAILTTRVLTEGELAAQGWTSRQMCYDSRHLLHYFRLLPENRMLFGLRAAWRCTEESDTATLRQARADFIRFFPAWKDVEITHHWSGLVCLSRNLTPFSGPIPGMARTWAALCYHGNGVAMGSYAGALLAAQITGHGPATPALMTRGLRRFELGGWRRAILPLIYGWYGLVHRRR